MEKSREARAGEATVNIATAITDRRKYFVCFVDIIINSKFQAPNYKQISIAEIQKIIIVILSFAKNLCVKIDPSLRSCPTGIFEMTEKSAFRNSKSFEICNLVLS